MFTFIKSVNYDSKHFKVENSYLNKVEDQINVLRRNYKNNDIIGILKIKDTDYSWVVTQSTDNDYYLKKDLFKKDYIGGNPFLDFRVNINSNKLLIYGHNSKYTDMPFKELEKYYDENYFNTYKYLIFNTENGINNYEIFSVYIETKDFSYTKLINNKEEWLSHLYYLKNKSLYKSNIELNEKDKILILQTCSTKEEYKKYKKKFLIIVAVRKDN